MKKIKLDPDTLKRFSMFSNVTQVVPKDCFESYGTLVFVVNKDDIGKAVGKKAINISKIAQKFRVEKVRVVAYSEDLEQFVRNVCHPNTPDTVEINGDTIILKTSNFKTRGYLIGKDASTLRMNEEIVKRYFDIREIKVNQIEVQNE